MGWGRRLGELQTEDAAPSLLLEHTEAHPLVKSDRMSVVSIDAEVNASDTLALHDVDERVHQTPAQAPALHVFKQIYVEVCRVPEILPHPLSRPLDDGFY